MVAPILSGDGAMVEIRRAAFVAVVFGTSAAVVAIISIPATFSYIQMVRAALEHELTYCKAKTGSTWHQLAAVLANRDRLIPQKRDAALTATTTRWSFDRWIQQIEEDPETDLPSEKNPETLEVHFFPEEAIQRHTIGCCTCGQGPAGLSGPDGVDGIDGRDGPEGEVGLPGKDVLPLSLDGLVSNCSVCLPSAIGPPGTQGAKGPPGAPGKPVTVGKVAKGLPGPVGSRGFPGEKGSDGPKGKTGFEGRVLNSHGPPGNPGPVGISGPVGAPGPQGRSGTSVLAGPPGPFGEKGDFGAKGIAGLPGPKGPTGAIGSLGSCAHCLRPKTAPGY